MWDTDKDVIHVQMALIIVLLVMQLVIMSNNQCQPLEVQNFTPEEIAEVFNEKEAKDETK